MWPSHPDDHPPRRSRFDFEPRQRYAQDEAQDRRLSNASPRDRQLSPKSTYPQYPSHASYSADTHSGGSSQPRLLANASVKRRDRLEEGIPDPTGLTVLHEPDHAPIADLVFVHGVGGGSFRSWADSDDLADTLWPMNWLSGETLISSARISTYGYSPSAGGPDRLLDISDFAKDLLAKLRFSQGLEGHSLNVGGVPLIFISHSLGGLVAKQAYLLAVSDFNSTYGQIAQATSAFVFFGTPHRELHRASVVNEILLACVAGWRPSQHVDSLRLHLPKLQDVNDKFRDLMSHLQIYSFYERPLGRSRLTSKPFVLPQQVATLDHPNETQIPLDAEHQTITRYTSRSDSNYSSVRGTLRLLIEKFKARRRSVLADDLASRESIERLLPGCGAPQEDLSEFSDKRIAGSCEWILRDPTMSLFLTDKTSQPQVLWCFGGPGSGKSVTATYIIESLMEESRACAYYFFRSGYQVKNGLSQFLRSTAFQLSQHIPEYQRKLSSLTGGSFDTGKAGHKLLWKKLFLSSLLQCNIREPFYIVVDGLDELNQTKELLQRLFVEMENADVPLRLLLISRPTLEIETSIERLWRRMDVQRLPLDNNAEDLEMYVREEMEFMPGDDGFKEKTVNEILVKADRNFLWAHLVVQEIVECQTEVQVEHALQQVPTQLAPLYHRMDRRLAEIFSSRPQDRAMGHTIIMWASCSRRPLHLDELEIALEDDFPRIMDMRQTIQRLCGEFVAVDKRGYVSVMHSSAREFLISNSDVNYHVDIRKAHHSIFSRCIGLLTSGRRDRNLLTDSDRAFLLFAASSWPFHLTQSSGYDDYSSLTSVLALLRSRAVLDWMSMLAEAGQLRAIVHASKALGDFLKLMDKADAERSPLVHRLTDKEVLLHWVQDLIRVVGKFGLQIVRTPRTVYKLLPAFCPKESVLYKQFNPDSSNSSAKDESPLVVRGKLSPTWDDCFAKFVVGSDSTPSSIFSLDRYFAILTKGDGTVHMHYSNTCETARRLSHGDHVLIFCADNSFSRIATYGFQKTIIWDVESGRLLHSIENPSYTKALAMSFQRSSQGDDLLLTFSDDRVVRTCSLGAMRIEWKHFGQSLGNDATHLHQVNAPHNAQFSQDGLYIAISYRGANPAVWFLGGYEPRFIAHFDQRSRSSRRNAHLHQHTRILYVQAFAWNPLTGHLLGTFYGGTVFKWHPQDDDFATYESRCETIKCSADGKLFVTGGNDGTLRIWDFEHLTPIAQLRYPSRIQDLDIGRNEARVYDLREQYCNIWEPSSLLRVLESDDIASDTHSSRESEQQSLAAESVREQEEFEPVTAFSTMGVADLYATGDDAGKITIADFDAEIVVEVQDGYMSIEQLSWCDEACLLVSVDLGRGITVRKFDHLFDESYQIKDVKTLKTFSESEEVLQTLLSIEGDTLLVVTPSATKIYPTTSDTAPVIVPAARPSKWLMHPQNKSIALGFSAKRVTVVPLQNPTDSVSVAYETSPSGDDQAESGAEDILELPNLEQSPKMNPLGPSEVDDRAHKVYTSPNNSLAMIEIYAKQTKRRSACMLLELKHFSSGALPQPIPARSIPSKLIEALYVSLGFVDADTITLPGRRGSYAEHRRSISRQHNDLSTFVFVDRDFWVCSVDIGFAETQDYDVVIHKHFFLPMDWQNSEWLEMATVTSAGHVLCPRNGNIAVVCNGLVEEFAG